MTEHDELSSDTRKARGPVDVHVGRRIRDRRRSLSISRTELANGLGLSVQQVQKYESGDSTVSASRLHQIGVQLAVSPAYFFDEMPEEILANAPSKLVTALDDSPSPQEIRQMILIYRNIENAELRHQLYELARTLAKAAQSKIDAQQGHAPIPEDDFS